VFAVFSGKNYMNCELAWLEQREFVGFAVQSLKDHPVVPLILDRLKNLRAVKPSLEG